MASELSREEILSRDYVIFKLRDNGFKSVEISKKLNITYNVVYFTFRKYRDKGITTLEGFIEYHKEEIEDIKKRVQINLDLAVNHKLKRDYIIFRLRDKGIKYKEIAKKLGLTYNEVYFIVKKYKDKGIKSLDDFIEINKKALESL